MISLQQDSISVLFCAKRFSVAQKSRKINFFSQVKNGRDQRRRGHNEASRMPWPEDRSTAASLRGRDSRPLFQISRNLFATARPARARGPVEDLWGHSRTIFGPLEVSHNILVKNPNVFLFFKMVRIRLIHTLNCCLKSKQMSAKTLTWSD